MKSYTKFLGPGLSYLIGLLGVIAYILVMATGVSNEDISMATLNVDAENAGSVARFNGAVDFFMTLTLISIILAAALILVFLIKTAIQDIRRLYKPAIFTGGIIGIFLFSWLFATGRESYDLTNKSVETVEFIRSVPDAAFYFADAALLTMMIIIGLALAAIIYTEVSKMFK
jgi:hypothetical protein